MLQNIIDEYPDDGFCIADGFDEAIIGIDDVSRRLIYSVKLCIQTLEKDMSLEEATEYFYYNVSGSYLGEQTPIWCEDNL